MSLVKAKQLKLTNVADIIIGGSNGNGTLLSLPSVAEGEEASRAHRVLKINTAGTNLEYDTLKASSVSTVAISGVAGSTVQANLESLKSLLDSEITNRGNADDVLQGNIDDLQSELNASQAAIGLNADGSLVAFTGANYVAGATTIAGAISNLDTSLKSVADTLTADTFNNTGVGVRELTSTTKEDAINELRGKSIYTKVDGSNPTVANDDTQGYKVGDVWVNGSNVFLATDVTTGAAVWTRVDQNVNAKLFTYKGSLSVVGDLPSSGMEAGDFYKVTFQGTLAGFPVNVGDAVVYNGSGWDKFDNTDSSVEGTSGEITVSYDAATEKYTVSIDDTYVGQTSITTLGNVTTGTWNATTISASKGGTGHTSYAKNDLLVGNATGGLDKLGVGTAYQTLMVNASGDLVFGNPRYLTDEAGNTVASATAGELLATNATTNGSSALAFTTKGWVDNAINTQQSKAKDEEFSPESTVTTGTVTFTLAENFIGGSVIVFVNGIKLLASQFSVDNDNEVTVDVDAVGYELDTTDVVSINYNYNPAIA